MGCGPGNQEYLQQQIFGKSQHFPSGGKWTDSKIPTLEFLSQNHNVISIIVKLWCKCPLFTWLVLYLRFNAVGLFLTRQQFSQQLTASTRREDQMW